MTPRRFTIVTPEQPGLVTIHYVVHKYTARYIYWYVDYALNQRQITHARQHRTR